MAAARAYITAAVPATMRRFGPSGSLKNMNSILEHKRAVMPKMNRGVFFGVKSISAIILITTQSESKSFVLGIAIPSLASNRMAKILLSENF